MDQLLCRIGSHAWSEWRSVRSDSCVEVRACQRNCGKTDQREHHNFGAWHYAAPRSCQEVQTCPRCGAQNVRQGEHHWQDWRYIAEGACRQVQRCARCPDEHERYTHQFGPPQHHRSSSPDIARQYCETRSTCTRCGEVEKGRSEHVWDAWQYEAPRSCNMMRRCVRCGYTESRPVADADHDWGEWTAYNAQECFSHRRVCRHCGKQELRREQVPQHQWGEWQISDPVQRRRQRVCRNCGDVEERSHP